MRTLVRNTGGSVDDNWTNRVLALISLGATFAMLAATAGLGRLLWDRFQGVESSSGLLEWSVMAMAGGIVADIAARSWRKHPVLAVTTLVLACAMYCVCRYLWREALASLSDPFAGPRWFACSVGGFVALAMAALSLGRVTAAERSSSKTATAEPRSSSSNAFKRER